MTADAAAVVVAVVVNPVKVPDVGKLRQQIAEHAAAHGGSAPIWLETTPEDPGGGQVADALAAGATLVIVCGGDGTVAACAGALANTGVAMAIVPAGTGNLLARNLGLPLEPDEALEIAFGAGRRAIDVLDEGRHRFVVMAGLGFDAALIRDTDEDLKSKIGWLAYVGGLIRALKRSPRASFELSVDDGIPVHREGVGALVGNVGKVQGGIAVLPAASPDDGLLDVILLAPRSIHDWPRLAWGVIRRRPDSGGRAVSLQGRQVRITVDRSVPAEYDGEFDGEASEMVVAVLPGALLLCAPSL